MDPSGLGDGAHPRVAALVSAAAVTLRRHAEFGRSIRSPWDFAEAMGISPERILKTVLLADRSLSRSRRGEAVRQAYAAAVVPFAWRIDMPAIARLRGWKGCEVATPEELEEITGYPRWGVSPLGLSCPVHVEERILGQETVFIGAGRAGLELELAPQALAEMLPGAMGRIGAPKPQAG